MTEVYIDLRFPWHEEEERFADSLHEPGVMEAEYTTSWQGDCPLVGDIIVFVHAGVHMGREGNYVTPPAAGAPAGSYLVRSRVFVLHEGRHTQWEVEAEWLSASDSQLSA